MAGKVVDCNLKVCTRGEEDGRSDLANHCLENEIALGFLVHITSVLLQRSLQLSSARSSHRFLKTTPLVWSVHIAHNAALSR